MKTEQNQTAEFSFLSSVQYADPFNEVKLTALFTRPDGTKVIVPAFWAGGNAWRVRYSSAVTGVHAFTTICSNSGDAGLHGQSGSADIAVYTGGNELYKRGSVCRAGNDTHLSYRDGAPFYWLGDTWWMGLTSRLKFPEEFTALAADRIEKGFNVVQIVAGLYPDMLPFDERGANEAGFPWDKDFRAVNPAYFDMADRRIERLCELGITPCIVGCWGFFMKFAGKENVMRHWDYLIARWAAYPVCWCIAGEANMPFYGDSHTDAAEALAQSRRDWNDVTKRVKDSDPFRRLITIHPTQNGHEQIDDETLLDLDMLQTGHSSFYSIAHSMKAEKAALDRKKLPVINGEVCYEGIMGSCHADIQRYIYISSFMLGACGHTYGANGVWQLNASDKPYGVSPHGSSWGDTPWNEAAALPGSRHIGDCKKFLTSFEWWKFTYRPDWVARPCTLNAPDGFFAAGIPGKTRVVFCPNFGGDFWGRVKILNIEKDVIYRAVRFNPLTNAVADIGEVVPDADGNWTTPGVDMFGDWIFALTAVEK